MASFHGCAMRYSNSSQNISMQHQQERFVESKFNEGKAKLVVLNFLLENEDKFDVEYTKFGNPRPKYFDMADSIVIAKAGHKTKYN